MADIFEIWEKISEGFSEKYKEYSPKRIKTEISYFTCTQEFRKKYEISIGDTGNRPNGLIWSMDTSDNFFVVFTSLVTSFVSLG